MSALNQERLMRHANRYEVIMKLENGILKVREAAGLLKLSRRQTQRLRLRVMGGGIKSLFHQRTHPAPNKIAEGEVLQILRLRRETYLKYNLLHFTDILRMRHGIRRSREFYRRLFLLEKLYSPQIKRRKPRKHRKRFEAPQAGILIQRDTSIHFWVPGADRPWKLILDLDDHSRKITGAFFSERDDVLSNMLVAWETISTHGIPVAYYMDNNPIFNPIRKRPAQYQFFRYRTVENKESVPQFKRALQELGIECIHSTPYEPQGKGKIERIFRFMQDRLVNEMMTAKVTTIHQANKYLKKWIDWYNHAHLHSITKMIPNERYLRNNAFRKLPGTVNLEQIFCIKYKRQVKADNTVSLEGKTYQIPPSLHRISFARVGVEVRIYLNQTLGIYYQNQLIASHAYKYKNINRLSTGGDILALHKG